MTDIDVIIVALFAMLVLSLIVSYFPKKRRLKKITKMQHSEISFHHENLDMPCDMYLKHIHMYVIPKIVAIKTEQMQGEIDKVKLEKGNYDIHFNIKIDWKKRK